MKYEAIAIDTSIFKGNGFNFDSGKLKQLEQFKDKSVDIIISDIVEKEVLKHLSKDIEESKKTLHIALVKAKNKKVLKEEYVNNTLEQLAENTSEEIAKKLFKSFKENVGAKIISSENVTLQELVSKYFNLDLPFEDKKDKKNEFPDAIALLSIERWAWENNKHVFAVSTDNGWLKYAENSSLMEPIKNIADAIEKLLPEPAVQRAIEDIRQVIVDYDKEEGRSFLYDAVSNTVDPFITADAESSANYDIEWISTKVDDLEYVIDENELVDVKILHLSDHKIIFELGLVINYTFSADISFHIHDSIDDDSVSFARGTKEKSIEYYTDAIITLGGLFIDGIPKDSVIGYDIELVTPIKSISFGKIDDIWQDVPDYD